MFGFDPTLVVLFCVVFIGLGVFNIIVGRRRHMAAQTQEQRSSWYKQTSILIGIEYILLSLTFLTSLGITYDWFPASLEAVVSGFYLFMLFSSAILAAFVIFQTFGDSRRRREELMRQQEAEETEQATDTTVETPRQREAQARKRRERRKKAAVARRRRAGRA